MDGAERARHAVEQKGEEPFRRHYFTYQTLKLAIHNNAASPMVSYYAKQLDELSDIICERQAKERMMGGAA